MIVELGTQQRIAMALIRVDVVKAKRDIHSRTNQIIALGFLHYPRAHPDVNQR